jgi:hypothetical protein
MALLFALFILKKLTANKVGVFRGKNKSLILQPI